MQFNWKFLLIKALNLQSHEDYIIIVDLMRDLFGFIEAEYDEELLIIKHQNDIEINLIEVLESINSEIYLNIYLFESYVFQDKTELESYLAKIKSIFQKMYYKSNEFYFNESLLLLKINRDNYAEEMKKVILKETYYDKDLLHIIKTYLENNMNTSSSAEILFMHRNTLINKIDKFIRITKYDIRNFKEATIIYNLL